MATELTAVQNGYFDVFTFDWTSDGSGNATAYGDGLTPGLIFTIATSPSAVAVPSGNYDVVLKQQLVDPDGGADIVLSDDLINSLALNRSAASTEVVELFPTYTIPVTGKLRIEVTNAGASKQGKITVYVYRTLDGQLGTNEDVVVANQLVKTPAIGVGNDTDLIVLAEGSVTINGSLIPGGLVVEPHASTHENGGVDEVLHDNLDGAGTNTHAQIDTHIADDTKHRVINDLGTLTTELFSASKIISELAGKAASSHTHAASDIASGTLADARVAQSNVTQHVAAIDHDSLLNFAAGEHIDWSVTGAEDVHVDRVASGAVTQHVGSIDHDSLLNFVAGEHYAWASDISPTAIHLNNIAQLVGDSGSGGTKGLTPAPGAGDAAAGKFLKADATWATPPGAGSTALNDLTDATISGVADDDIFYYDSTAGVWKNKPLSYGVIRLKAEQFLVPNGELNAQVMSYDNTHPQFYLFYNNTADSDLYVDKIMMPLDYNGGTCYGRIAFKPYDGTSPASEGITFNVYSCPQGDGLSYMPTFNSAASITDNVGTSTTNVSVSAWTALTMTSIDAGEDFGIKLERDVSDAWTGQVQVFYLDIRYPRQLWR